MKNLVKNVTLHGVLATLVLTLAGALLLGGLSQASASELLFGYALPTQNLNGYNPVPENRSNGATPTPNYYNLTELTTIHGDKFSIGSEGKQYHIDTITVYMGYGYWHTDGSLVQQYDKAPINETGILSMGLWFGPDNGTIQNTSLIPVRTRVWYGVNENSQSPSTGRWYGIYQFTFNLDTTINGGQTYDYFLDGVITLRDQNGVPQYHVPSLMVAYQPNSGVEPVGVLDNAWYLFDKSTGVITAGSSEFPFIQNGDANVLIYGSQVPIPGSLLLLGSGLVGLGALGWRRRRY